MAGKFGAIRTLGALSRPPLLYKPYHPLPFPSSNLSIHRQVSIMAQPQPESHTTNGSSEPSPNGDVSTNRSLLRVKKFSDKAVLPSRVIPLSAGYDLSSAVETKVPARGKALVATDISIAIPEGTYARVAPRWGLTWKHSIDVGAGVIDADYRGPVGVILFNHSDVDFEVKVSDRVAQLIIQEILTPDVSTNPSLLRFKKLSDKAVLPSRASPLSAGYDLSSAVETKVPARGKALVATDISIEIPEGTYALVAPRSGLTLKHSIGVGAGVIDADYRGPVGVILFNHSDVDFEVKVGDRVAQLIIQEILTPDVSTNPSLLRFKKLSDKAVLPSRASPLSAGYDLSSAVETKVPARGKALVATDISIEIPEGTYARVAPRWGLTLKDSIDVGAGVIHAHYRGPVGVILLNHSDVDFEVKVGDRVAQLIIEKIVTPNVAEVEDLDETVRGEGGFGSTDSAQSIILQDKLINQGYTDIDVSINVTTTKTFSSMGLRKGSGHSKMNKPHYSKVISDADK
ncbi:Deoxyuridine 5'-triphosphate nucleotidohydrolase, partial [Mucuna pruriens]